MSRFRFAAAATAVLLSALAMAGSHGKWINVHVRQASEKTTVDVRLPLDFIALAIDAVDTPEFKHGKVRINFHSRGDAVEGEGEVEVRNSRPDVNWVPLLKKMKDLPQGEYVKVDSPDAKVSIRRTGDLFLIHVVEQKDEKTTVDVRLPVALLDAVSVDENQDLDVKAFVAQLDKLDTGDLVRVTGDDADVRIWVE
jgi:hypothetical protein